MMSPLLRTIHTLLLALPAALLLPQAAHGAAICGVSSSTLNFGNYDVLSPLPTDSSTNVLVLCVRNPPPGSEIVSYTLSLSVGTGSYAARTMNNGPSTIIYNLYTEPGRSAASVWGDGTSGTQTVSAELERLNNPNPIRFATHTIYGRIPAQQDVPVGPYSSSVIVTMDY